MIGADRCYSCFHYWSATTTGWDKRWRWGICNWCKSSMSRWLLTCTLRATSGSCRVSRGPPWRVFTWTETCIMFSSTFVATVPWLASGRLVVPYRQLKLSLSLLIIDHLCWQSVTKLQWYDGWGPLQWVHFLLAGVVDFVRFGCFPWVWVRNWLVIVEEIPCWDTFDELTLIPASKILISLKMASLSCWNFHSRLSCSRARFCLNN